MTREPPIPETVSLHIPFRVVTRGGRKEMHLPEGATHSRRTDNTLVKALARAFRWKRMLESGEFATIAEHPRAARHADRAASAQLPPALAIRGRTNSRGLCGRSAASSASCL